MIDLGIDLIVFLFGSYQEELTLVSTLLTNNNIRQFIDHDVPVGFPARVPAFLGEPESPTAMHCNLPGDSQEQEVLKYKGSTSLRPSNAWANV